MKVRKQKKGKDCAPKNGLSRFVEVQKQKEVNKQSKAKPDEGTEFEEKAEKVKVKKEPKVTSEATITKGADEGADVQDQIHLLTN